MAQDGHKEHPKYINIFWWLVALTIIEIAVAIPEYAPLLKGILLIGLACSKALLVANYFMHLKFEKRTLAIIVMTPFIICVLLVFALMPDLTSDARHEGVEKPVVEVVDTSAH